jgi:DNA helicase-2/ATP-dependent DNA helicase PcrA
MNNFEQKYETDFANLNEAQKQAVTDIYGPIQVIAGPGTGKTQLLALRVAYILKTTDTLPQNILLTTFTEAGAQAMRERIHGLIGEAAYQVPIFTFHGFGQDIINHYNQYFFSGMVQTPADEIRQIEIIENIIADLPVDSPFHKKDPSGKYLYVKSALSLIGQLKDQGITPNEFESMIRSTKAELDVLNESIQPLQSMARISAQSLELFEQILASLDLEEKTEGQKVRITELFASELHSTLVLAKKTDKISTKPLTTFKDKWLKKDYQKNFVFKSAETTEKLIAFVPIYEQYQENLSKLGLIDFSDMILEVIKTTEKVPAILFDLAERFQFVMIDEFQDTNSAQLKIIENFLAVGPDSDSPNVLAVGDDDQGIYKFQGAELSNILNFARRYDAKSIPLTENYRSGKDILDFARAIIVQGDERLENKIEGLSKRLNHHNQSKVNLTLYEYETQPEQFTAVARDVKEQIENGVSPKEIAVLSKRHAQLEEMTKYFQEIGVPYNYQARNNIFENPQIKRLLEMFELLTELLRNRQPQANFLFSQILRDGMWQIDASVIWQLSVDAYKERENWLELSRTHSDERLQFVAGFFISASKKAAQKETTFEEVLDILLGNEGLEIDDVQIYSPLKIFHFSKENLEAEPLKYLRNLSAIRLLRNTLREHFNSSNPSFLDAMAVIHRYLENDIRLNDTSRYAIETESVNLMTAYGAKGLEFEQVHVLDVENNVWARKVGGAKINTPENMPLTTADDEDDWLRLLYVALTRAKTRLQLHRARFKDDGKLRPALKFIQNITNQELLNIKDSEEQTIEFKVAELETDIFDYRQVKVEHDYKQILKEQVASMRLNVTALGNFLNLEYAGPEDFLFSNVLHFPQKISDSAAFGNIVHAVLATLVAQKEDTKISTANLDKIIARAVADQRVPAAKITHETDKAKKIIEHVLERKMPLFELNIRPELDFSTQHVVVDEVPLTGKIDAFIQLSKTSAQVIDYKTGKPSPSWGSSSKLHFYKRQLIFYKLLVEKSRDYANMKVNSGSILFVEPMSDGEIIQLEHEISEQDVDELRKLIKVVWKKIQNLDFPDTSQYKQSIAGIRQFESDLLEEKI